MSPQMMGCGILFVQVGGRAMGSGLCTKMGWQQIAGRDLQKEAESKVFNKIIFLFLLH